SKAPESSASDKPPELPKPEMPKAAESRVTETRSVDNAAPESSTAGSAPQGSVSAGNAPGDADRPKPVAPATSAASSLNQPNASSQPSASTSVGVAKTPAPVIATDSGKQSAPKPGGKYLIQVGAFSSDSAASAALERIQGAGLRGFTEKIKTDRGERIRVRAGPFPTRDVAEQAREKLKATGLEAALIAPS
ncbi:MAG: SPOR domain-containing protein, partial [Burkholderiales bacterium]